MKLGNIRLSHKLSAIMVMSLIGLIVTTALGLTALDKNLLQERERQAKNMVEATYTVIEDLQKRVDKGELSLEQAQNQAKQVINSIRYGDDDYLWVNDMDHVIVVHPIKPSLNGKDLSGFKDPDGKPLFVDVVKLAKAKGEGSIGYRWPKEGYDEPIEKISYIKAFSPWGWVLGTGVYLDEVKKAFMEEAIKEAIVFLIGAVILGLSVYFVSSDIRGSVHQLSEAMKNLAQSGNTEKKIPLQDRQDEVGEMAHSVEYFRGQLIENEKMVQRQRIEEETQKKRAKTIQKLADEFDLGVNSALQSVASAAQQLNMTAEGMSATADQTSTQASAVASASQQTSANVQTVAAASEELTASIREVGSQVTQSTEIAQQAANKTQETEGIVQSLSQTADQISEASKLIGEIADQTNMLALNATIEAARAGEAGKGFAVVASEVKTLANQTGRATEEIGKHVNAIQSVSQKTVSAIAEINSIIGAMNEISGAVAAAVEEQSAATYEITRNIEQASQGTQEVSSNIVEVNQAANDTGNASKDVLGASTQLNSQSVSLRSIIENFLTGVKSA